MPIVSVSKRLTTSQDDYRKFARSSDSLLYAVRQSEGGEERPVECSPTEIELSVGNRWASNLSGDEPKFYAVDDKGIKIPAGGSVIVETAEILFVPNNLFGTIYPKGSLFQQQAVYPLTAKIDPTWRGPLRLLLQNGGTVARKIKRGNPVGVAVFSTTEITMPNELAFRQPETANVKRTLFKKILTFISEPRILAGLCGLVGAVIGAVATLISKGL